MKPLPIFSFSLNHHFGFLSACPQLDLIKIIKRLVMRWAGLGWGAAVACRSAPLLQQGALELELELEPFLSLTLIT